MTGIKRTLLGLFLVCPVLSFGQVAELSLKGGVITNKMLQHLAAPGTTIENPIGFGGGLALTFGLPAGFRLGIGVTAYEVKANLTTPRTDATGNRIGEVNSDITYGTPLIPVEAMFMKRFNAGRIRIDIGGTAGVALNKRVTSESDSGNPPVLFIDKGDQWVMYGALAGLQYRLGCRTAIGVEVQPKWLKVNNFPAASVVPVLLKYSISL